MEVFSYIEILENSEKPSFAFRFISVKCEDLKLIIKKNDFFKIKVYLKL